MNDFEFVRVLNAPLINIKYTSENESTRAEKKIKFFSIKGT